MQLKMKPVSGDTMLRGKEEDLKFYTDSLSIDQQRGGVNTGGRMTRKRTIHDLRDIARTRQSEWWSRLFDETIMIYLSGARGVNADYIEDTSFTGYAANPLSAPDNLHLLYGGAATSKASLAATDVFSLGLIDRVVARSKTMGGGTSGVPKIQPIKIDGEEHFVLVMHPFQEYSLRASAGSTWLDIQKAAAAAEGRNNPIFKGGLGMYNNVVLHDHNAVINFSDYGAGGTLTAARALFLGRQAGVVAFGSNGSGLRFDWNEELEDRGNQVVITTSSIFGVKKSSFSIDGTSRDFGTIALDTYIADPS
jgi:N4-gp56 family major capsid protein